MRSNGDIYYVVSDERLQAYARVPLIDRLRWLDELIRFTQMWRAAPISLQPMQPQNTRTPD